MYKITDELFEMIMSVRESGQVNMFDVTGVQKIAMEQGHTELAVFLADKDNVDAYTKFIMDGTGANPEIVKAYK